MKEGLLWFDDSRHSLEDKVRQAVHRYRQKYGELPTTCLVNAGEIEGEVRVDGVLVRAGRSVLPFHLWLGREEAQLRQSRLPEQSKVLTEQ